MIAEEKAIANGNFTNLPAYLGYCHQALQEKAQKLLSICTEEGSPRLQLDFGNFQMLSMLLQTRFSMCSSIREKMEVTFNHSIEDHGQALAKTPTIHIGKILRFQGVFNEQQSLTFTHILQEVNPYFTDKTIFALLFLSIVMNNDESRGMQNTCQYFIQRLLDQKYEGQNAEEILWFVKGKVVQLTNYLNAHMKPPSITEEPPMVPQIDV